MNNKKRRPAPTLRDVELRRDLQLAREQVETGTNALRNPDLRDDLRQRIERAVRHWQRRADEITAELGE